MVTFNGIKTTFAEPGNTCAMTPTIVRIIALDRHELNLHTNQTEIISIYSVSSPAIWIIQYISSTDMIFIYRL